LGRPRKATTSISFLIECEPTLVEVKLMRMIERLDFMPSASFRQPSSLIALPERSSSETDG